MMVTHRPALSGLPRVLNSTPGVRKRKSHDGGASSAHPKIPHPKEAQKAKHAPKTPIVDKDHDEDEEDDDEDDEDDDEDEDHDEDEEDRDEDEDHDEGTPQHRKRDTRKSHVTHPQKFSKSKNSQDSQESDAVETLTHLGGSAHKPDDKFTKVAHVGKGVLKVPCQLCKGPIAVKVSGDLRLRNNESTDGCKICQKCFNELYENEGKALALKKVAEMHVERELSLTFPWNMGFGHYTCTEQFSVFENWAYKFSVSFQISYNFSKEDLSKRISIHIDITDVNERTVNLRARAPAREFEAMKAYLGHDPYPEARFISNPGVSIYEWEWTNIPKVVIFHSQLVSKIQELTGTIERCPMMLVNSSKEAVTTFTTNEQNYPVLYPFKNYFDFNITFAEKVSFELLGQDNYTRVTFDKKCLLQPGNPYGINVVADDRSTNTIYMTIKYVSLKEYDGEIVTILHRLIARANYSVMGAFPFFVDEIRKLSFSTSVPIFGNDDFKVKAHIEPVLSKIPGIFKGKQKDEQETLAIGRM